MSRHTLGESHFVTLNDGRRIHYRSQGSGDPTVVFEGGMGFSSAIWGLVVPKVSNHARTVAYDRAGAGKSDWDNAARTIDRICDDLDQLLDALPGPVILVGYSWGGPLVRRITSRKDTDILALVLVNQTDEKNPEYAGLAGRRSVLAKVIVLWTMHTRGLLPASWNVLRHMPSDCRREIVFRDVLVRGVRLFLAEGKQFLAGLMLIREDELPSGIDVTVITGVDPDKLKNRYSPGMVEAQRDTAHMLDGGKWVQARESAHFVPLTEPDVVADEVLRLIRKCNSVQAHGAEN